MQHDYEMIIYKDKDGNMRKGYFPKVSAETWCRVKVNGKYGKKYIWCMVNKEAKVAVYFYDDGSRGRKVLRDFLGETEIDALQSDGFRSSYAGLLPSGRKNVYMYLDKELVNVDHLCCLAHARAKFKYAQEQGKDADAEYFITNIGRLYDMEEQYRSLELCSLATEGTQELADFW